MVVSVPMPEFKFEVSHVGDGFEIVTNKASVDPKAKPNKKIAEPLKVIELRRALEVTNQNVNFMLVTGAGSVMNAIKNEQGEFIMKRGILKIEEHKTLEGYDEYFGATMGFMTDTGGNKGYRQWGCAHINPALLLDAVIDDKPLEQIAYAYVSCEKKDLTPMKLKMTHLESPEYRASLKAWVDENRDIVAKMKSYTVTAEQTTNELQTYAKKRIQTMYNTMNAVYGKLNDPVNINEVGTWSDTSAYMVKACPTQALAALNHFYSFPDIKREHVLPLVCTAIQTAAEICASYQPILAHGEQSITTQQLVQFLHANTTPTVGSQQIAERNKLYREHIEKMHCLVLAINGHPYEGDETYKFNNQQKTISAVQGGEKMNLAGDFPRIEMDEKQRRWTQLNSDRVSLLSEQVRLQRTTGEDYILLLTQHARQQRMAGEAPTAALGTLNKKLADINAEN